jgi:hypothetical protein
MVAWLAEVGIISVRDLSQSRRPPLPSELLATFVVFGGLGLAPGQAARPAAAVAWGIVVATLLSSRVDFLKPVGDFFAGSSGGSGPVSPGGPAAPATGGVGVRAAPPKLSGQARPAL